MTVFDGLRALLQRSSDDEDVKLQRFVVSADRVGDELRLRAQTREGSGVALWSVSYAPTAMEQLVLASNSFTDALSALQAVATAIEHPHDMQRQSARVIVAADGQSLDVRLRAQARLMGPARRAAQPQRRGHVHAGALGRGAGERVGVAVLGLGAARGDRQGDDGAQRYACARAPSPRADHAGGETRELNRRLSRAQAEAMRAPAGSGSFAAPIETGGSPAVTQTTIKEKNMRSGVVKGRVIGGGKKRGKLQFDDDSSDDDVVEVKKPKQED